MKKLLFFSLLILSAGLYAQDSVRVSQLPSATDPDVDDIMYFIEDGISTNITRGTLFKATSDSVASLQDSIAKHTDTLQVHQDQIATLQTTSGDVTKVGTPVNNQLGVWTGDGTIEGDEDLTFSGTILALGTVGKSSAITLINTASSTPLQFTQDGNYNYFRRYNYTDQPGWSYRDLFYRYGGSQASPTAAPSNADILLKQYNVNDGTSDVYSLFHTAEVSGAIATGDFDTKFTWGIKDGVAAVALGMTLDPAGLQLEDGFNVTTLANDDAETNLLSYDTGSGLVTYRSVGSLPGASYTFDEGLTEVANNVDLGGAFDATISIVSTNDANFRIQTGDGTSYGFIALGESGSDDVDWGIWDGVGGDLINVSLNTSRMQITDEVNLKGFVNIFDIYFLELTYENNN